MYNTYMRTSSASVPIQMAVPPHINQQLPPQPTLQTILEKLSKESASEVVRSVTNDIVDDLTLEVVFELHRKLKLDMVAKTGYDIFGQVTKQGASTDVFDCVNCKRQVNASRFAPHLEKCMGQGRNSSRLANKRLNAYSTVSTDSRELTDSRGGDSDDEYKDDPSYDTKSIDKKKPPAPISSTNRATPSQLLKKPKGRPRKNQDEKAKQTKLTAKSLKATIVKGKKNEDSDGNDSPQVSEYVDILGDDNYTV